MSDRLSKKKVILFEIIIFLFFFLLLEAGFRVYQSFTAEKNEIKEPDTYIPHRIYHHFHKPNLDLVIKGVNGKIDRYFKTNSYGMLDGEHTIKKPEGMVRIGFMGDSYVGAVEVPPDKKFARLLPAKFKHSNVRAEGLNFGSSSFSPVLEYLELKNFAVKFNLDLIFLFICYNDIHDDIKYSRLMNFDENGLPVGLKEEHYLFFLSYSQGKPPKIKKSLIEYSSFLNFLITRIKHRFARSNVDLEDQTIMNNTYAVLKKNYVLDDIIAWEYSKKYLREIHRLCEQKNIRLILVSLPLPIQVSEREWIRGRQRTPFKGDSRLKRRKLQNFLKNFSYEEGIEFIDLIPPLESYKRQNPEKILFFPYDGHFTMEGHLAVTQALYDYLKRNPKNLFPE